MTKKVRIENADISDHQLVVEVREYTAGGELLVSTEELRYPTQLAEFTIWGDRFLVVRELKYGEKL